MNSAEILENLTDKEYIDENTTPNTRYIFKDVNITPRYYALPGKKYIKIKISAGTATANSNPYKLPLFCMYCYFNSNARELLTKRIDLKYDTSGLIYECTTNTSLYSYLNHSKKCEKTLCYNKNYINEQIQRILGKNSTNTLSGLDFSNVNRVEESEIITGTFPY